MDDSDRKLIQYLAEAHASEVGMTRALGAQILIAPRGSYRKALESHQKETRDHARRVQDRIRALGKGADPIQAVVHLAETALAQALAVGKVPLELVRGSGGEERVLKDAKDACASEALEIATYTAIERMAQTLGDDVTARLAASIRAEEERALARLLREIPRLADAVIEVDVEGNPLLRARRDGRRGQGSRSGRQRKGDREVGAVPGAPGGAHGSPRAGRRPGRG